jgi:calcineurin-like phosphoesterase family protein
MRELTYFWADTHFNHFNIIKHAGRTYRTADEMNRDLIARWNETVTNEDAIWLLGDFMFKTSGVDVHVMHEIFYQLHGWKGLILGNHDERNPAVLKLPWDRQEKLFTFKREGMRAELCHYPLESWKGSNRGSLHLHGHCHGNLESKKDRRFDVGCDVEPYPVEWREILTRVEE